MDESNAQFIRWLEDAEAAFSQSRALGKPRAIENRGPDHAAAVTRILLAGASTSASILCGRLSAPVFSLASLERFLSNSGATLRVLLDKEASDDPSESLVDGLLELARQMGADERVKVKITPVPQGFHLGVFDLRDMRLEKSTRTREATVLFNDAETAAAAETLFNALWSTAYEYTREPAPTA